MAYFAPVVTAAGLSIPTYADIVAQMVSNARMIFGSDIYLENDSQDYQLISANALITFDALQSVQLAYNARSPVTAIGSGLDALVKLNGLARKAASYSVCDVTIAGVSSTVISNGIVADVNGNLWNMPASVVIGINGTVHVSVTSQIIGNITALIGDINKIYTPTAGWTSVTNAAAATPGIPIETDAQLRSRQAISTAIPSQTLLEGTAAGIASVANVSRWKVYENDTNTAAVYGAGDTGHSITCVVEGGTDQAIAEQIFARKGIGGYTNGPDYVDLTDEFGIITRIRFYRPSYVDIDVAIAVTQHAGYTTATTAAIKAAVVAYLNSLDIGNNLVTSAVQYEAMSVNANLGKPTFSITALTICKHGGTPATTDIAILFNEVTRGNLGYVTVTVT